MCCTWTERTWSNCHIADYTSVAIFAWEFLTGNCLHRKGFTRPLGAADTAYPSTFHPGPSWALYQIFSSVFPAFWSHNHGQNLLRDMKIINLFPWCKSCSFPSWKVNSPYPFFNRLKTNWTFTKRFATLSQGKGVTTDKKDVFIQIQNTTVCSKALVFCKIVSSLLSIIAVARLCP